MLEYWEEVIKNRPEEQAWVKKKFELAEKRGVEIVRIKMKGLVYRRSLYDGKIEGNYLLHSSFYMEEGNKLYLEESIYPYSFIREGKFTVHKPIQAKQIRAEDQSLSFSHKRSHSQLANNYDRRQAVRYAERWWNEYNPAYKKFTKDCTNYISQCLLAGGAKMHGAPKRELGWWYEGENWSYSWALAHSLRWYLSGASSGLMGEEVDSAEKLLLGDVICYDFEGDGSWDHTTIVVAKDAAGMPLVNAHTNSSRNRYWSYEDSLAWTPKIKYKFFHIKII